MRNSQVLSTGQLPPLPGGALVIPATVHADFVNTHTLMLQDKRGRTSLEFHGTVSGSFDDRTCPVCKCRMHVKKTYFSRLKHINIGPFPSHLVIRRNQLQCPTCKATRSERIPFEIKGHRITDTLQNQIIDLLEGRTMTLKSVARITGVDRNIIKEIDKKRLESLYLVNEDVFAHPRNPCPFLAIDEFSLHKNKKYATAIMNLDTGEVIYIAPTKSKAAIEKFMEIVGEEFMNKVEAVVTDMNGTFSDTIKEKYPHIDIVYDRFHLMKNFNDIVTNPVRIAVYKKLIEEGRTAEAAKLKHSKYLLLSSKKKLEELDNSEPKKRGFRTSIKCKLAEIFDKFVRRGEHKRKKDHVKRYQELIESNELLLCIDLIKSFLTDAYESKTMKEMCDCILEIIEICESTEDKHFQRFANLLSNHFDGITNYAKYRITTGPLEGVNNKIKTIRRSAYGFMDDMYFFLLIMDACNPRVRAKCGIIRPTKESSEKAA